jgi:hypothetical protein
MKSVLPLLAVISISSLAVAPASAQCGLKTTSTLFAGKTMNAGTVSVSNDSANLTVTYRTHSPWVITAVHLAVADSLAGIPQNGSHNPTPGHFPINSTFGPSVTSISYTIPLANFFPGETIYVGAQAEVQAPGGQGGAQTAWADGPSFGGHNWATYMMYVVESCGVE